MYPTRKTMTQRHADHLSRRLAHRNVMLADRADRLAGRPAPVPPVVETDLDRDAALRHVYAVTDRVTLRRLAAKLGEY